MMLSQILSTEARERRQFTSEITFINSIYRHVFCVSDFLADGFFLTCCFILAFMKSILLA